MVSEHDNGCANKDLWVEDFTFRTNQSFRYTGEIADDISELFKRGIKGWHDEHAVSDSDVKRIKYELTSLWAENQDVKGQTCNNGEYLMLMDKNGHNYFAVLQGDKVNIFFMYAHITILQDMSFSTVRCFASGFTAGPLPWFLFGSMK